MKHSLARRFLHNYSQRKVEHLPTESPFFLRDIVSSQSNRRPPLAGRRLQNIYTFTYRSVYLFLFAPEHRILLSILELSFRGWGIGPS